jgi:NAD(P)-dependent dehydrogenase (short-subunit alcohol dehydrogenase family)
MGYKVFAMSRRESPIVHENLEYVRADLSDLETIPTGLSDLLGSQEKLDLIVLNAGMLGSITDMADVGVTELKETMDVNLWSNKIILDWLFEHVKAVAQVVAISSGAAVNGSRGWNGYSLSKAALNMLVMLYAAERPNTHFSALAPGLVDTAMQDYLCGQKEVEKYTSLARIQSCRGTDAMPSAEVLAESLPFFIEQMQSFESGCFKDIRNF